MSDLESKKNYSVLIPPSYGVMNLSSSRAQKIRGNPQNGEFVVLVRQSLSRNSQLDFSERAARRLRPRSTEFSPERLTQLSGVVEKARVKGVRDVLVLDGSMVSIVSVSSSTIVTMLGDQEMIGNMSTNIDRAVVL